MENGGEVDLDDGRLLRERPAEQVDVGHVLGEQLLRQLLGQVEVAARWLGEEMSGQVMIEVY